MILLGSSLLGSDLSREIRQRPELGINLISYVDDSDPAMHSPLAIPRLGSTSELEEIVAHARPNAAIVALQDCRGHPPWMRC